MPYQHDISDTTGRATGSARLDLSKLLLKKRNKIFEMRNCKLKLLFVYHSENPSAFEGLSKTILLAHFRSNSKAWMTVAHFKHWFMNCFIPEVEKFCTGKKNH
jgi:hypothetical protein